MGKHRPGMFLKGVENNMKRCLCVCLILLTLLLTACGSPKATGEMKVSTVEELAEVEKVVSVTEQSFTEKIPDMVAYKVLYQATAGKLAVDVVLPSDYHEENKGYSVLLYFPEVNMDIDSLATKYGEKGIIVIRPYARGRGESEGIRDLGGEKDLTDAKELLNLFDRLICIQKAKMFVAGASEGSITALRLFAEDEEQRITGCAVVDAITDLPAFCEARGESVKELNASLIGKTYQEAPEEYHSRSAVTFYEKLTRPLLLLHFTQNPYFPIEQTDSLYQLVRKINKDCLCYKIDDLSSDFTKDAAKRLISWMEKYNNK